jgi:PAS domain S-box-containing protein
MITHSPIPDFIGALDEFHPLRMYYEENIYLKKIIEDFIKIDCQKDIPLTINLLNQLSEVNIRYTRKENQLFPFLEKRGWFGPSQGMWRFQDDNRALIKEFRVLIESGQHQLLNKKVGFMLSEVQRLINIEEFKLFPKAFDLLIPEDWQEMRLGEREIGWMHKKAVTSQSPKLGGHANNLDDFGPLASNLLKLNEGELDLEQLNLLFQLMPFDITFVDENDRVRFYNRGEERIFPRSAGVIGREVRFCHPPKSVNTVLEILEKFKAGQQDIAEFWIQVKGRFIHIRYFAVRDANKKYRGVIEVSQDVTDIKNLQGERRLLQWNS